MPSADPVDPSAPRPRAPGPPQPDELDRIARDVLGLPGLHDEQRAAVSAALAGHDVLAVLPTGFGKSAIYQLVAAVLDGPTVVVSPLLALQHDQVRSLADAAAGDATAANSALGTRRRDDALERFEAGTLEFLFVAPEQLVRDETLAALQAARPSLFVVDEAHCVSAWGHDFRPDYLRLPAVIDALGHPTTIALTATASPPVRREIVEALGLRDPVELVGSFDRPNIGLSVERATTVEDKDRAAVDRVVSLVEGGPCGLLYVATRKRAEALAAALCEQGVPAAAYHAGLSPAVRHEVHTRFTDDEAIVVVATTAFGMGIDRADVRFVVHADPPESLDAYAQEIGRAGRDGAPATAILYYRPEDLGVRRGLLVRGRTRVGDVATVVDALEEGSDTTIRELADASGLSERRVTAALGVLRSPVVDDRVAGAGEVREVRDAGEVGEEERPEGAAIGLDATGTVTLDEELDPGRVVDEAAATLEARLSWDRSRLELVRGYAETAGCRRRFLLATFGESLAADCGNCDTCASGSAARVGEVASAEAPFPVGSGVVHHDWGRGEVMRAEGSSVVVLFDRVGYKQLSVPLVLERDLLRLDP